MDKTSQILQRLQASADSQSSNLNVSMDYLTAFGTSLVNNPIYYAKVLGVLILTVIIVMVSISLIADC